MRVEAVLEGLGGVASATELQQHCGRAQVRVALRRGRITRDNRGRYSLPGVAEALRAANRLSGVLCLDSAAQHHGWKLKRLPDRPAVAVARNRKVTRERRDGLRLVYADLAGPDVAGAATSFIRTVMDCAARMPFDEALTIADSSLRESDVTRQQLLAAAERMPLRYRKRCLRVAHEADGRADNPFESVLRAIALDVTGLTLRPQVWVRDLGRAGLADGRLRLVVEAESFEFHGFRRQLKRDCERYNGFVALGWVVIRFAWEHVMFEPDYVRAVLRAVVARLGPQPLEPALDRSEARRSA